MAKLAGKAGFVDTVGSGAAGAVLGIKSWTLDYTTDALETTDFSVAGVRAYIVGCSGWSGSFEGYKDAAPQTQGASLTLRLYENATCYWYGTALLTGTHPSTSFDGVVTVSYDFQGTGALSHTEG